MSDLSRQQRLIHVLLDPQRKLLGAGKVRLIETHISWVLLAGRHAYKIKKAVDLGFLDFATLEQRRFYCDEELRLNRRLAPQLYQEVVPIGGTIEAPVLGQSPAIEYAVKMRRFPQKNLLRNLLAQQRLSPQLLDGLAVRLASFHGSLPPAEKGSDYGIPDSVGTAAMQNFEQLLPLLPDEVARQRLAALSKEVEEELAKLESVLWQRREQGHVRECHGDLHLGNIVQVQDEAVPFDAIEFNAGLRWSDTMNEVAFLAMDLLAYGQPGLAWRWLDVYLQASGDHAGLEVFRFYLAYRAMVRAKISAIRAHQPGGSGHAAADMSTCLEYVSLAGRCLRPRRPLLIITHGLPGSGKSTFSQLALERLGAIRLRSDVERKRLFGLTPLARSAEAGLDEQQMYGAAATQRTYAHLAGLAERLLLAGFPVIVDAAFLRQAERAQFAGLAQAVGVPFAIASIRAGDDKMRDRIAARQLDASEADANVLELLRTVQEPLTQQEEEMSVIFTNDADSVDGLAQQPGWTRLKELAGD